MKRITLIEYELAVRSYRSLSFELIPSLAVVSIIHSVLAYIAFYSIDVSPPTAKHAIFKRFLHCQ